MSALPDRYIPREMARPARVQKRREKPLGHPGFMQPLLQTMIKLKNAGSGRGVFTFTGPAPQVGVSYVTQVVARELVLETRGTVLIASSSILDGALDNDLRRSIRGAIERAPNVWAALDEDLMEHLPDNLLDRIWVDVVPQDFDYILIDCPSLNEAGDGLRLSPDADATFLVVAAGETTRDQIEHAQNLLRHASARLEGIVLNRRTYPVPGFLYRLL